MSANVIAKDSINEDIFDSSHGTMAVAFVSPKLDGKDGVLHFSSVVLFIITQIFLWNQRVLLRAPPGHVFIHLSPS